MNWKIDNSILQAGALVVIAVLGVAAAAQGNWNIGGSALIGLFAVLNIHPKSAADAQAEASQNPQS